VGYEAMAAPPLAGVPDACLPRLDHQPLWEGCASVATSAAREAAGGQAGHLGRFRRLPECRQELCHQHAQDKEGDLTRVRHMFRVGMMHLPWPFSHHLDVVIIAGIYIHLSGLSSLFLACLGMQGGRGPRRDQGVAVHHTHEAHLPD